MMRETFHAVVREKKKKDGSFTSYVTIPHALAQRLGLRSGRAVRVEVEL